VHSFVGFAVGMAIGLLKSQQTNESNEHYSEAEHTVVGKTSGSTDQSLQLLKVM